MKTCFSTSLNPLMIGLPGPELTKDDEQRLLRIKPASVILFTRNFVSVSQIKSLIQKVKELLPGVLIAVDHEGGRVVRFPEHLPPLPAPRTFGEERNTKKMFEAAKIAAYALKDWGIDLNLAPVVDILMPSSHPRMIDRCFGSDPELISDMANAFIEGMHQGGILCCAKHFPGVGPAELDPHETDTIVKTTKKEQEYHLKPFKSAIKSNVECIMISHIKYLGIDPDSPATLSKTIITDILRDELGFSRTILSDDLEMSAIQKAYSMEEAAERALKSGCDILLSCKDTSLQDRAFNTLCNRSL
ncbi:MAG: beta-N-acetylhexosaminidase [Candidatus Hydrogenedentota bacterium]